ncbi:MAG: GldG family protein [Chromatiales bacterium]
MRLTSRSQLWLRWQGYFTAVLIVAVAGLLALLSTRHERTYDWTAARRHTISEASRAVLAGMQDAVTVTAYVGENNPLREQIRFLIERYQRVKPDVRLEFVNPDREPERVRSAGIRFDGEMVIAYGGRDRHVDRSSEQAITSALQSLARGAERWVVFASGHGERDPQGRANHDLAQFGEQLGTRGFKVQPFALAETGSIPDNTALLVIASPQTDWLPAEVKAVENYVEAGGNLLLLTEPGAQHGLEPLLTRVGVTVQAGTVIDPTTQKLGIDNAAMALVLHYPPHPATEAFGYLTAFPLAAGLKADAPEGWETAPLLQTAAGAWSETGELQGNVGFDDGQDGKGPLDIGVALTRSRSGGGDDPREQRVVIIGDGDFLSNTFLGNSGNLDLGLRLFTWLTGDDALITIPARTAPDQTLQLSRTATLLIGLGFLFVLPLALLGTGAAIWIRRRGR